MAKHPAGLSIETYNAKRDFAKTAEPKGRKLKGKGDSFVVQKHDASRLHWDFRLEHDGVLVSWAVPKAPPTDATSNRLAVQTEDHPMEYATFEGGIPKGEYGGGQLSIWDAGTFRLHKWRDGKEVIATLQGRPDGGLGGARRTFGEVRLVGRVETHKLGYGGPEDVEIEQTNAQAWLRGVLEHPEGKGEVG